MIKKRNVLTNWWYNIDNKTFVALILLFATGTLLLATVSPAISKRIGIPVVYFLYKHFIYMALSITIIVILTIISEKQIKKLALLGLIITIVLLILLPFCGHEVKGSKRWLNLLGTSIQPSEFLKSFYTIFTAMILAERAENPFLPAFKICIAAHIFIAALLLLQPDLGMVITISIVTGIQLFIGGLPLLYIAIISALFCATLLAAYAIFPHVSQRIENFLQDSNLVGYQVQKSLESYKKGGFFGIGPGEGTVKYSLPDSHTDFIFAVAGEEFGIIFCLIIVLLIAFVVVKGFANISQMANPYHIYVSVGVIMYIAFQSIFNIGVTLNIFPTKGMTLPFISYGGSSMLALAICAGVYLNAVQASKKHFLGHNNIIHMRT